MTKLDVSEKVDQITTFEKGIRMEQSVIKISDHGAEMSINTDRILIKEPDRLGAHGENLPGDSVQLTMSDVNTITRILRETYGVDISSPDFKKQIEL